MLQQIGDSLSGVFQRVVDGDHGACIFRLGHQAHRDLGDDAEHALGADDDASQVVTRSIWGDAAGVDDLSIGQHHLKPQDVVAGQPIEQAVRPAGVLGDVAADRGHRLAGWIRCIVQPERCNSSGQVDVDDAGLNDGVAIFGVDLQDATQARQADHQTALNGHRATGQAGSGAACHNWHACLRSQLNQVNHLVCGAWQHHHIGRMAVMAGVI